MTSIFDPNALLDAQMDTPSTKRPPIPVGDYPAVVGEVTCVAWQSRDGSKSGMKYNIELNLQLPHEVQEACHLHEPSVKKVHGVMLDLTEAGTLDTAPGKNRGLRAYREALDLNKPGDVFSARKLTGQMVLAKIKHGEYNGEITEEVAGIAAAV